MIGRKVKRAFECPLHSILYRNDEFSANVMKFFQIKTNTQEHLPMSHIL